MSEREFKIELLITDWACDACGTYCKPTGNIKQHFIGIEVEHKCMNPSCGRLYNLDSYYPKWEDLTDAIYNGRHK